VIQTLIGWGPAAFWAVVLFFLSETQPDSDLAWLAINDKVIHLGLYFVLGGTLSWGGWKASWNFPVLLLLLGVAYGVLDEWHQSFVPGRDPSLGDVLADTAGVILGFFIIRLYLQAHDSGPKAESN
jgi:VanZ family protein